MKRLADESGLAGIVLVIVIAWALVAVLQLTRTLVAAQNIEDSVDIITSEVGEIKNETGLVQVLEETTSLTSQILEAAAPLTGQLDQVVSSAGSIDASVTDILSTAGSINSTAKSIGATVDSINGRAGAILGVVREINCGFGVENPTLAKMVELCGTKGVRGINLRLDVIIADVRGIKSDTGNILAQVREIHKHANSIDCSPALLVGGTGEACGKHQGDFGGG